MRILGFILLATVGIANLVQYFLWSNIYDVIDRTSAD